MFSLIPLCPLSLPVAFSHFLADVWTLVLRFQGFQGIAGERGADGPPGSPVCFAISLLLCHLEDRGLWDCDYFVKLRFSETRQPVCWRWTDPPKHKAREREAGSIVNLFPVKQTFKPTANKAYWLVLWTFGDRVLLSDRGHRGTQDHQDHQEP